MLKLHCLFLTGILSCGAFAQSHSTFQLESILHSQAKGTPVNESNEEDSEELDGESISNLNASSSSVDDVLRLTAAANTARGPRSSGESIQVRGLDQNKIFVMVDGSRQNFQTGHNSLVALDTSNLKAVKVYKSPATLSHSGSLGGGVNFVTKDPKDILKPGKVTGSEFKVQTHSANSETFVNAKSAFNKKPYSGFISLSRGSAEDLKQNNGDTLDHSSYEDFAGLSKIQYKKIRLKYEHFKREDDSPTDPTLNPPNEIESLFSKNQVIKNEVALDYEYDKTLSMGVYQNKYQAIKERIEDGKTSTREIITTGGRVKKQYKGFQFGGEFFGDAIKADLDGKEISGYPKAKSENYSAFSQYTWKPDSIAELTAGLRYDGYNMRAEDDDFPKKSAGAFSKKLGLDINVTQNLKTHITYSEGFKAPSLVNVFPSGLHMKGDEILLRDNFFIPNKDLNEETSEMIEMGFRFSKPMFAGNGLVELSGNTYQSKVDDYIKMRMKHKIHWVDEEDGTTQFVNIPNVLLTGSELEGKLIYDAFEAKLTYSQVRGKILDEDEWLKYTYWLEDMPADQYNLHLNYFLDDSKMVLGYLGHYSLEQNRVNSKTIQVTGATDSYIVHSAYIKKGFGNFEANFRVDNLTNKEYRKHGSNLYESERDFKIGLKYKINTL